MVRTTGVAAFIFIAIGLHGCDRAESQAKDLVKTKLLDPGSADFRGLRDVRDQFGVTAVCGEVNAKNRMGGYSGYRAFMVKSGQAVLQSRDDDVLAIAQSPHFASCLELPPDHLSEDDRETYEAFLRKE